MKGIILAGGEGTRLYPLTKTINKHLLPVYDKPMVYYPIATLMLAGIRDILVISTPKHLNSFQKLLVDGSHLGLNFEYSSQTEAAGIAQAFIIGENFINSDSVCLVLGDNIHQGTGLSTALQNSRQQLDGATVFSYYVDNPKAYGVVEFDEKMKAINLEEKPKHPKSNYAVTGLYMYDNLVTEIAKSIKPSKRGELEITDVNNIYLNNGKLDVKMLGRGSVWLDMGTHDSLLAANNYIHMVEKRQGLKVGCLEEIAWRMSYIDDESLEKLAESHQNIDYTRYLNNLLNEKIAYVS